MKFSPRPYQKKAVEAVISRYNNGLNKMLLHLPTGAGKTVIATLIIEKLINFSDIGKILFIAHREEILDQTRQKISSHLPSANVQIEQGSRSSSRNSHVTIASVQSLIRRKERFDPKDFSVIICDECHRALAPSWSELINYFYENQKSNSLLLGMTATPRRSDGRSALDIFDEVAFEISRVELQDLGYLVPMQYYTVRTDLDLDRVKISGGDFAVGSLSKVMNTPTKRALALNAWMEKGRNKKTIAFCAGVEHAHQLASDFAAHGIKAEAIDGKTTNRKEILQSFKNGDIEVLSNYGVLTEGFDDPGIECILLARPTTSPLVYTQCVGRGLRPFRGKRACTIIDIIDRGAHQLQYGASDMNGLPRNWRSNGRDPYRESYAISQIKVSDPDSFLKIKRAASLEEVQSILMSMPPEYVTAGLDGERVLYYSPAKERFPYQEARQEARKLLHQANAPVRRVYQHNGSITIALASPEINNERWAHLIWHLERVTSWSVKYSKGKVKSNPRAFLRSMLSNSQKLQRFDYNPDDATVTAWINNLSHHDLSEISEMFREKTGMNLEIKGQISMSLF